MLYTFKTISQQTFQLELADDVLIGDVKKQIVEKFGDAEFPRELLKIIYDGKIYQDGETVGDMCYNDKKFVVVMNPKRKPGQAASETPVTPAAPKASEASPEAPQATPVSQVAPATPAAPARPTPAADVPEEHQATVDAIMTMGYTRSEVVRALRAAFWNGDRAVEYLLGGIPDGAEIMAPVANPAVAEMAQDGMAEMGDEFEAAEMGGFMDSPEFQQLRVMAQQNPAALPQIIQEIGRLNPELMEFIAENQEAFLEQLNRPVDPEEIADMAQGDAGAQAQAQRRPGGPGVVRVSLTPVEAAAVQRIRSMGFPEQLVMEAFIVCNRDEDLTINYILARLDDQE
ncbi:hypothetical protein L596_029925 [Steinernema carpocapsae]|uniref:UV excision repair protein RAD23 n=1 Tax=Steinernema carpocapsae TaxID=34508 RepID=A0A4U5LR74_STECR|nr:hypothetical protein L596_029925 [Steinernema carpocapsae]